MKKYTSSCNMFSLVLIFFIKISIIGLLIMSINRVSAQSIGPVKDIVVSGDSYPYLLGCLNNELIFGAYVNSKYNVWISDGSEFGTNLLSDSIEIFGSQDKGITLDGNFYLGAWDGNQFELYSTDGSDIYLLNSNPNGWDSPSDFHVANNQVFFAGDYYARTVLMKSDSISTGFVYDSTTTGIPTLMQTVNDELFFANEDSVGQLGIYRTMGDAASTFLMKEIMTAQSSGSGLGYYFATLNDTSYNDREPWVFNTDSCYRLKDINAGTESSDVDQYVSMGAYVYFPAWDGDTTAIWKTDGTPANTTMLIELPFWPELMTAAGNKLFFIQENYIIDETQLWVSDGMTVGTYAVPDSSGNYFEGIHEMVAADNEVFFSAYTSGVSGLWHSDGTGANTYSLSTNTALDDDPTQLTICGNNLFFVGSDSIYGQELWTYTFPSEFSRWKGCAADSLWSNPLNWSGSVLPNGSKNVRLLLNSSCVSVVLIDTLVTTIKSLHIGPFHTVRIQSGGHLVIDTQDDPTIDFALWVQGQLILESGGSLTIHTHGKDIDLESDCLINQGGIFETLSN